MHDLLVAPWVDPVAERTGHHPHSPYVSTFWLPILGPSATWVLHKLGSYVTEMDEGTYPMVFDATELGCQIGVGRAYVFDRAIGRLVTYRVARFTPDGVMELRRRLPNLPLRYQRRLPTSLRTRHSQYLRRMAVVPA